jgi:tRNA nucleotidyltransferase (CCA-adding enzyme)
MCYMLVFMKGMHDPAAPLTVITTHANADFDALASLLAAQKLYPGARIVFPGSQERNLKNFFISSLAYLFDMTEIGAIDIRRIARLVLVDTRQPGRIGKLAQALETPGLEIHIYDHHPAGPNDVRGTVEVCEPTGANVTLLVEAIQARGIEVSPEEATIMCLGLYEDTGSFTFASTRPKDFQAAAFLLEKGANLNIVSDLIARELNPEQVAILNDMIQNATRRNVNGIEVAVTTVARETYVPDFAFLVQKMVRMENLDVLFALGLMESKVYLVARSRLEEVDVAAVLAPFGGGGHAYAAAAVVKGETLEQTEARLVEVLHQKVAGRRLARHLMSAPAICVAPEVTCEEANQTLTRYNVNALLVVSRAGEREELLGYITRQVIEKALYHKLGAVPVREYMTTEAATVGPEADLAEIQRKIIDHKQRILPVVDGGAIAGVVTRTDLLNILVGQRRADPGAAPEGVRETLAPRTRNIARWMQERIPAALFAVLRRIGEAAERLGCRAYVVGGFVRDLLLARLDEDIDIVIEGDGVAFARHFGRETGARTHTHEKFGTAVLVFPDGLKIDVASARMEYYKFPAALPVVEMSSIKLDLTRRDFTINTLAIHLNPERFGTLIDFFNAQKDLKDRTIRVLHNLSFVEDPTRVFRAIRFEQRFGFTISRLTAGLIENAVGMDFFRGLSGRRVFSELRLILEEDNPVAAIQRLEDFQLLKVIHPSLAGTPALLATLGRARQVLSWYDLLFIDESYMKWAVYFLALLHHADRRHTEAIVARLDLTPRLRRFFVKGREKTERALGAFERRPTLLPSEVYRRLAGFRTEWALFMMAATEQEKVQKAISLYFTNLRRTTLTLKGSDLLALGLKPGPVFREILQAVFDAKLNGRVATPAEELELARALAGRHRPAPP